MLLILAAQIFTVRNINGLKTGNQEAAVTFTINNRLQEIVNTAAQLESRVTKTNLLPANSKLISDSLAVLGYNASVLEKLNVDEGTGNNFKKLNIFINEQIAVSFITLEAMDAGNKRLQKLYADSLIKLNLSDSIYKTAVNIEKGLEIKLKETFDQNAVVSQKLSTLNKLFALIAIAAILILGTIIINRHRRQVGLIIALESANDKVRKSAMVKEQFLANMSHEIRTPLNAIKGFSRLLQETELTEEQQKFSDIIENSSNNLLHLVNDILDISKIEAGKMIVEQKEFDIKRMLQTLGQMFENTANEKQLNFNCQLNEAVPQYLHGDPDRIYQILINLVNNAFKFTKKGFITLSVSKSGDSENEIILEFKIEDSGIGIPLKQQGIIFERFQQIGSPQENLQKGTGLGLAIVKNLAKLMGGSVSVASIEGQGTVFKVLLPFPKNYFSNKGAATVTSFTAVKFNGAKVLVAEDNRVNQLLITRFLQKYDIEPVIKENGIEVLEAMKIKQFDLLLLDVQMPLLDGYKTSEAIRKTGSAMPIVAMTAYVMETEKEKCKAAGMNDYLAKPLDEGELNSVLVKYLNNYVSTKENTELKGNAYLLQLSGGDEKMAAVILNQVKQEIPDEIEKLNKVIGEKSVNLIPAYCHHLISSISPLGNDSVAMKIIQDLQKINAVDTDETVIIEKAKELKVELEKLYSNLATLKEALN